MRLANFYHVWAAGDWREPVTEHLDALDEAGFTGYFAVGVVGSNRERHDAIAEITRRRKINRLFIAAEGFEQVTLTQIHRYAQQNPGAVMYAHTKGAHDNTPFRARWRRSMTAEVVSRWRENVAELEQGHDAVGCHWLTEEEFGGVVADTPYPMFGGNFWIATCDYLSRLPSPDRSNRYDAEAWIGLGDPTVVDRTPGWPGDDTFTPTFMRGGIVPPALQVWLEAGTVVLPAR